ncbi:hypothetical protein [Corynebacterium freiburgense]|uniref:hypothetical protein n=1 Tax=Corynebacterium freiburgense TaxID=556548 RepID=UPI00047EB62A|nr:hypothetical protein [Corynebacterium freiburgense]WJZ03473.1 hypothetical protein CFREI_11020 [Corynebacterium freiburgense]WJZ03575.1 hypothetical protein CFREI_11580 [Corynebacterium freiburgense]WJZ03992.1 hypothetical protein CFREI_13730 [Corynebacterium freiburgense]
MITDSLTDITTALQNAGIPADIDPLCLHPPCAWVHATRWLGRRLDGTNIIEIGIHLISPETDIPAAIGVLEKMLTTALDVLSGNVVDTDLGTTVTLPGGEVCPAFSLTIRPPH